MKKHINTILRMNKVYELTEKYYEPENHAKCYKAIWKKYIYPIYPMCYRTYLSYIKEYNYAQN